MDKGNSCGRGNSARIERLLLSLAFSMLARVVTFNGTGAGLNPSAYGRGSWFAFLFSSAVFWHAK